MTLWCDPVEIFGYGTTPSDRKGLLDDLVQLSTKLYYLNDNLSRSEAITKARNMFKFLVFANSCLLSNLVFAKNLY
jgi:hypothetical protein